MRSKCNGFSLIELMLVTALIAALAGMSVPLITAGIKRYTAISASRQVAGAIRSARIQAVSRNEPVTVRFDVTGGTYHVLHAADHLLGAPESLPAGAQFVEVSSEIRFNPLGRLADPATAPIIIVVGNGLEKDDREITVSASGRIQLP